MKVGVRISNPIKGLVQTKSPQDGAARGQGRTPFSEFQRCQSIAVDARPGREIRDRPATSYPGNPNPVPELDDTLGNLRGNGEVAH